MIAIVNISKQARPRGWCRYSLRINTREICQFRHKREDGLVVCLEKAAAAARMHELAPLLAFVDGRK